MATSIKLKKSSVAGRIPQVGDLEYGEIAINYADGKLYYKNSSNQIKAFIDSAAVQSLVGSGGGGAATVDSATIISIVDSAYVSSRISFANNANVSLGRNYATADSGQTVFTGLDYQSNNLIVFLNGIILDPRTDYTATNGTSLTLTAAADSGDELYLIDHTSLFNLENAVVDSADVTNIINTAYIQARQDFAYASLTGTPVIFDSAGVKNVIDTTYIQGIVNTAYVQARQDFSYASLTGAPNVLDSADVISLIAANASGGTDSATVLSLSLDSAEVTNLIDSAYIQARQTTADLTNYRTVTQIQSMIDSEVNALIDAAPGALDTLNELAAALGDDANFATTITNSIAGKIDSAQAINIITSYGYTTYDSSNTLGLIDSAYVQARQTQQDFAYSSLTGVPTTFAPSGVDSNATFAIIDSAYIIARQTQQDFAYSSLTGAPNVLDSANVISLINANVTAGTDSAAIINMIDSAYVQARQLSQAGGATTISSYFYTADSGQTAITGVDDLGSSLSYTTDKLQVFLNGILLVDSQDYTQTSNSTITLTDPAALDDVIQITTFVTQAVGTLDSAGIISLIDSAYIQARQADIYRDSAFVTSIVDAAYIQANQITYNTNNFTDSAYVQAQIAAIDIPTFGGDYVDSATVATIVTSYGYTTYDSSNAQSQIEAYGYTTYDSSNAQSQIEAYGYLTSAIDSATVATIVTSYGYTTYDSSNAQSQIEAYGYLTSAIDSAGVISLIDSAYVQLRQTAQDFAYSSLTGTPNVLDSDNVKNIFSAGTGVTYSNGQFAIGQGVAPTDSATFAGMSITNNLTVKGNLYVTGTEVILNATTLEVENPIIHMATANENTDAIDIGFVGHYSDDGGTTKSHTGLIRDASNAEYYLFNGLQQSSLDSNEPSLTVNVGGTGWELANLNVGTISGQYTGFDSDFGTKTTDNLTEGSTNLYYTNTRVETLVDSAYIQARQSASGTTQLTFKTIAVSGQTDVVANDSADTLTLVAGSNMTITTSGDTITFAAASGGGGGGSIDSAATINIINDQLLLLDIGDIVGADGNPGEVLQSNGNGNSSWVDMKQIAIQKALAMTLIFG